MQEGSSNLVVCLPPQVGSEEWRRLNGIHQMCPGPVRRAQRATCSRPYLRRDSSRCPSKLWAPGEPGRSPGSSPSSRLGAIDTSLLRGDEGVPPSSSGQSGLVLQGDELVRMPGAELGLWICDPPGPSGRDKGPSTPEPSAGPSSWAQDDQPTRKILEDGLA